MTDSNNDWCTIESDPGVFTELLEALGCHAVELQELYSLEDDTLSEDDVYGLIFLFPWKNKNTNEERASASAESSDTTTQQPAPEELFFAHQVTTNACATQALLSVVLNTVPDAALGTTLQEFKTFTASFPPALKGMAIAGSETIQQAHNSFARADAFWQDPTQPRKPRTTGNEEVYHFVAYIPFHGIVYELDGLQSEPVHVGVYNGSTNNNWLQVARQALQTRMAEEQGQFNLMAVIPNQLLKLQQLQGDELQLQHELHKRQVWKFENQRRRHNYVPLCVQLLKEMAKQGTLEACVQQAQERRAKKSNKTEEDYE